MNKKARNYTSDILNELMSEITPAEQRKTDKRMLLALKIGNAMKAKGWRKIDLATETNQQPSVITKWLSGTHNFESDTLFDLEDKLGTCLVSTEEKKQATSVIYVLNIQTTVQSVKTDEGNFNIPSPYHYIAGKETPKRS